MRTAIIPPKLKSSSPHLIARSADLNAVDFLYQISGRSPLARYVGRGDIAEPPAPAWYIPATGEIYIHVDEATIGNPREIRSMHHEQHPKQALALGLLAHEAGHAAISERMAVVEKEAPRHQALLTVLEELRVENHAVRRTPMVRKFLRASFGLILANLTDEFVNRSHVVRAWTLTRGRTLAGVTAPDETEAVDTAARVLLGDDLVDTLTDLLQEALTLRLDGPADRQRMIEICDDWHELVGDPAESTSCTTCVRHPGEGEASGGGEPGEESSGTETSDDGETDGGDGETDEGDDGEAESMESGWGKAGADDPDLSGDDEPDSDLLNDEDAELMKMLKRDLTELMQDEWTRELDTVELAKSGEWAQKVFGNRRKQARLSESTPTSAMRQHVVKVAAELSNLSLPAIAKTAHPSVAPPGRLRSREALRASAERAQAKMVTAKPWKATVRRHSSARPLVIGIATDTSGSMRWAEAGVAEFAYVYANAGHRIGARTAAVTFGDSVHRIARPGEVMNHVLRKTASDGTEEFDHAMASLDGVLHLTTPSSAARILFVISDGAFVKSQEPDKAARWMKLMLKAGTHVVWITDGGMYAGYGTWMDAIGTTPNLTVRTGKFSGGTGHSVFEMLNEAALEAIRHDVA
jgi:hypothetical protein